MGHGSFLSVSLSATLISSSPPSSDTGGTPRLWKPLMFESFSKDLEESAKPGISIHPDVSNSCEIKFLGGLSGNAFPLGQTPWELILSPKSIHRLPSIVNSLRKVYQVFIGSAKSTNSIFGPWLSNL